MVNFNPSQKIKLFTLLFQGRSDVYAFRWENQKRGVSGYSPVKNKTTGKFLPITDAVIESHLRGYQTIGIYPLLQDNNSNFIAADFDGECWIESAKRLFKQCEKYNVPAYVERSRSGKGGHIWWFFEQSYPAYKSRKIFLHLIKESKNVDDFDKAESFDRLFPNQDYHTGKGLGNLIALPLQGDSRKQGNSIFLDPGNNFKPANDQWELLNSVQKISVKKSGDLFDKFSNNKLPQRKVVYKGNEIPLVLGSYISIPKSYINKQLSNFLTEELNFFNNEYAIKQIWLWL